MNNNIIIDSNEVHVVDIWRIQHPDTRKYKWHSSHKPFIFCQLDFLISYKLINSSKHSSLKPGYKTDHSIVTLSIDLYNAPRGAGHFKFNTSLLIDNDYKNAIKRSIF